MTCEIPEPFAWNEDFRVDYDAIDTEHKGLFKAIFDCAAAPADGDKLKNLVSVVETHFSTEEAMFDKAKYADKVSHKTAHDEFLTKIKKLSAPLDAETIKFAKKWLCTHIKTIDFKYKGKL